MLYSAGNSLLWRNRTPIPPSRPPPSFKSLVSPFSSSLVFMMNRTRISPISCSAEISSNVALAQSQPSSDYNPWSDFAQNVPSEWDGFGADFSREGKPIELLVVPEAYREWEVKVFDWQTQCPTLAQPDDAATRYCIDERSIGSALAYSYSFTGSYVAVWPLGKNNSNQLEVEHCLINPNDKVSRVRVINLAETEVLLGWSLQDGDQLVALPLPLHLPQQLQL
ncbi:hypothetical protein ISN44_As12g040400 [Arabidopsis suecica]|uniref:Uncharacterized protein n=1 Tax=Arabidopsis suecica TaxID=45249 RepID=A0A8T1YSE8_ARASU|nr:hypothetical protein ISN44_As12g040400 [Arabidopsis suecica]